MSTPTPNFEGLPFDIAATHSILLVPYYDPDVGSGDANTVASGFNVVAYGPNSEGTSVRGSEPRHIIGTATTYDEADAIRTPAWNTIHAVRRLRGSHQ